MSSSRSGLVRNGRTSCTSKSFSFVSNEQFFIHHRCRYYIEPPSVVIRGRPSGEMADRLDREEKVRIATQREHLGPKGLEECERTLEAAKKEHEKEIPTDILKSFPVPDVKSIAWIPIQSVQEQHGSKGRAPTAQGDNSKLAKHVEQDGKPLPFFVQYDHVKVSLRQSRFTTRNLLSTSDSLTS